MDELKKTKWQARDMSCACKNNGNCGSRAIRQARLRYGCIKTIVSRCWTRWSALLQQSKIQVREDSALFGLTHVDEMAAIDWPFPRLANSIICSRRGGWHQLIRSSTSLRLPLTFLSTECHRHTDDEEKNREETEGHAAL